MNRALREHSSLEAGDLSLEGPRPPRNQASQRADLRGQLSRSSPRERTSKLSRFSRPERRPTKQRTIFQEQKSLASRLKSLA